MPRSLGVLDVNPEVITGGNNTFVGRALADTFHGRAGNDRLKGQGGNDILDGGSGNDTIPRYNGAAFTGLAGQLHYLASGANTIVEGDVNGDKLADFQIQLTGLKTLTAADFIL